MKNHIRFVYKDNRYLGPSVFELHVDANSIIEHLKISFDKKCGSDGSCPHFFGSCQKIVDVKKIKYRSDLFLYYNLKNVGYLIGSNNGLSFVEKSRMMDEKNTWSLIKYLIKNISSVDFFNRIDISIEKDVSGENVKFGISQANLNLIRDELIRSLLRSGIQIIE